MKISIAGINPFILQMIDFIISLQPFMVVIDPCAKRTTATGRVSATTACRTPKPQAEVTMTVAWVPKVHIVKTGNDCSSAPRRLNNDFEDSIYFRAGYGGNAFRFKPFVRLPIKKPRNDDGNIRRVIIRFRIHRLKYSGVK